MTRESEVVQALVDLADTLVADYDVIEVLTASRRPLRVRAPRCRGGRHARLAEW